MTDDPYQAPVTDAVVTELPPDGRRFRRWCFVVNSTVAGMLILTTAGVLIVDAMTSRQPRVPVPGLMFTGVVIVYVIGEWRVYRRSQRVIERLLGLGNGLLALYVGIFGVVMTWNLVTAPVDTRTKFAILAWAIGSAVVTSWLGACAWYRLRRRHRVDTTELEAPEPAGQP